MSLRDSACYTLTLRPTSNAAVVELVEPAPSNEVKYIRARETRDGEVYSGVLYGAGSGYISDKIKSRRLQLHGPDETVPFEFSGKLSFEWTFKFEENTYRWKRSNKDFICTMDRRPDPPVEVCLARQADSKAPGQIQMLHYNIDRFYGSEIKDLRGLETLFALTFCCLADAIDERHQRAAAPVPTGSPPIAPGPSPSPEYEIEDANEVIVGLNTDLDVHIARAIGLLQDESVLFIVIRTRKAQAVQRALSVLTAVTRYRHRECLPDLKQYVVEEAVPPPPGPKVIQLNAPKPEPWSPPPNLAIYLSSIDLPDLKPNPSVKRPKASQPVQSQSQSPPLPQHPPPRPPVPPPPGQTPQPNPTPNRLSKLFR